MQTDDLFRLDTFIASQPEPRPTRPEAVRVAVREWLADRTPATPAAIADDIHALETRLAAMPEIQEQSPKAALHTMDRAIAENELVALKAQAETTAVITGRQIKQGRKLLRWSVAKLAVSAKMNAEVVLRAERTDDEPQIARFHADAVRIALEAAGVIFVAENGDGPGVRLRKA